MAQKRWRLDRRRGRPERAAEEGQQDEGAKPPLHASIVTYPPRTVCRRTLSRVSSSGTRVCSIPREESRAGRAPERFLTPNSPSSCVRTLNDRRELVRMASVTRPAAAPSAYGPGGQSLRARASI